ncbi:hypothetical protein [Nocardia sp. NRRL S-836]|uniref:hypothetical protein n=1 Tax=Nocardia sp. NRRL S-836 TaxID=1519492 RepID=UPI000A60DB53|nr:hypothetical protein [Nocardia sp. NRRL S-836]
MTQRGSDQHGFARDDKLKQELANELRANGPTRAQEWREPELPTSEEITEDTDR